MGYILRYGTENQYFDVTNIIMEKCLVDELYIVIDKCDFRRDSLFGDPALYIDKYIFIYKDDILCNKIDGHHIVFINLKNQEIKQFSKESEVHDEMVNCQIYKVNDILYEVEVLFGNFLDSDQLKWTNKYQFYLEYIKDGDSVLQVGSNFGRDSLVLNKVVNCKNHVVLEYHKDVIPLLEKYKETCGLNYNVENGILSLKPTVRKDIFLIRSDILLGDGSDYIEHFKLNEFKKKYQIDFNVLVFNCSGYFYYILKDFEHLLDSVDTIILDNDILIIEHKKWVRNYLEGRQFRMINNLDRNLSEFSGKEFYQVWIKT